MKNSIKKEAALGALTLGLAIPSLCPPAQAGLFGRKTIQSGWAAAQVAVDGADTEWKKDQAYENEGVAVAARNDGEFLYVYISPKDKEARRQFAGDYGQSFFVWLDPSGGTHTALGVKLARQKASAAPHGGAPAAGGRQPGQPPEVQMSSGAAPGEPPQGGPVGEPGREAAAAQEPAYSAGFVTDDADSPSSDLKAEGMEAAVGTVRSRLTVEIKVPLSKLEDLKDGTLGLGVQTTEPDAKLLASLSKAQAAQGGQPPSGGSASSGPGGNGGDRPSGPPPGGSGGERPSGPPPGGMGSGGPGMGGQSSSSSSSDSVTVDPVKFWIKVKLASR